MAPSSSTSPRRTTSNIRATLAIADTASWYCSIVIVALILFTTFVTFRDTYPTHLGNPYFYYYGDQDDGHHQQQPFSLQEETFDTKAKAIDDRLCDEIYVVGEGETLHTISDKCGDPFIVERNPHIHDPDDVFPGLVIRIVPVSGNGNRKLLR